VVGSYLVYEKEIITNGQTKRGLYLSKW